MYDRYKYTRVQLLSSYYVHMLLSNGLTVSELGIEIGIRIELSWASGLIYSFVSFG